MKNSQRILDSIGKLSDSMIESAVSYEYPENIRKKIKDSSARPMKRLAVSLIAAAMCIALAVTCFANADLIKSLFQREQELIDPHSVIIDKQDENNGYTLTVEKIFSDEDLIYVYYKLHSPKPFETGYLTYENLEFGIEGLNYKDEKWISPRAYTTSPGHPNRKKALLGGAYIAKVEEPTCDIEGVLEMNIACMADFVTTDEGRKVIREEPVEWESGVYHFAITGLSVTRWIPDENGRIDEENCGVESFDYAKELDVAFDLDVNDLEELPSTYYHPDSEFTLEGCTFKVAEIKQNAKNLWVTIESTSDKLIEIEDQHFNPLMMFINYRFSDEFNLYDSHTHEETTEFTKIYNRNKLWERSYSFGVKLTDSVGLWKGAYATKHQLKDGGYDKDTIRLRFIFDGPVYPEDIESIYVYNDENYYPLDCRPEKDSERFELNIWENK